LKALLVVMAFRRPLQTKDLHHDFIVENIIGDQKVCNRQAGKIVLRDQPNS